MHDCLADPLDPRIRLLIENHDRAHEDATAAEAERDALKAQVTRLRKAVSEIIALVDEPLVFKDVRRIRAIARDALADSPAPTA